MSRESFVFVLGLAVFLTSFLGIPSDWKEWIFIVVGVLLMILGYSLRRTAFLRSIDGGNGERKSDMFTENTTIRNLEEQTEVRE